MHKKLKAFSFAAAILLLVSGPVFAKDTVKAAPHGQRALIEQLSLKEILSGRGVAGSNICGAVQATIKEGTGARDVVKTAVELGHSACLVVKCALHSGGSLEEVIGGAIEAGATSDVVSRCALDAGAEAKEVDRSLLRAGLSLCYIEPEGLGYSPPGDTPLDPPLPPPIPPPGPPSISNSSF
jgi:hypothetical protein